MAPFRALYGRGPPLLFKGDSFPSKMEEVNQLTALHDGDLDELI